jgi:hypothetical protein
MSGVIHEYDARNAGVGKVARVVMVEELRAGALG